MKFVSARDGMYNGVYLGSILIICSLALYVFFFPSSRADKIGMAIMCLTVLPFLLATYFKTFYEVTNDTLIIHSGPFKQILEKERIFSIKSYRSLYTAPALSRDRFQVRYDKFGEVQISPLDKEGFLEAMGLPTDKNCKNNAGPSG